jgi:hypothetical protein
MLTVYFSCCLLSGVSGGVGRDSEAVWNHSEESKDLEQYVPEIARDALNPSRRKKRAIASGSDASAADKGGGGALGAGTGAGGGGGEDRDMGKVLRAFIHERVARYADLAS